MDSCRSQMTLEYFAYMEIALNTTLLGIEGHCAMEAEGEVGQKDGLDSQLGKMLVKREGRNLYEYSLAMNVWLQTEENDSLEKLAEVSRLGQE
jgi:hypothetical protein